MNYANMRNVGRRLEFLDWVKRRVDGCACACAMLISLFKSVEELNVRVARIVLSVQRTSYALDSKQQ
jgi:hypothetical protein